MKAEFCDLKGNYGEIRFLPESIDDLWHLQHLIAPGDLVFATTLRSVTAATDKIRPEKVEKRPVRLGVRVGHAEFSVHAVRLRISGVIEHGVDAGSHHTFNVDTGYEISVIRAWKQVDFDRIDRAVKASVYGVIHILTIEEGEAELFRQAFFEQVLGSLHEITGPVIIAGPGFVKDDFVKFAKNKDSAIAARAVVAETRRIGRGAVQEVIGLGALEKLIGDLQLAREVKLVDEILLRISQDGPVAYGMQEVADAIGYGAAEQLVITDSLLRDGAVMKLVETAEAMRSKITVLSSSFEPGERLDALGGIAALLRYKIGK
jgi:protein pelota